MESRSNSLFSRRSAKCCLILDISEAFSLRAGLISDFPDSKSIQYVELAVTRLPMTCVRYLSSSRVSVLSELM